MALDIDALADEINNAIGATDKDGNPIATTQVMKKYAEAVITTLSAGIVSHLPGTVTGVTAPGSPLSNGAALGGLIAALIPATWQGIMSAAIPAADPSQLANDANQSTTYLMASSLVNFDPGEITGTCTSTPTTPGPLAAGAGTGGEIAGLSGAPWSILVMPPAGNPVLSQAIYDAIANYIMSNAEVEYLTGSVTGVCPAGGGPLAGGAAAGGVIS